MNSGIFSMAAGAVDGGVMGASGRDGGAAIASSREVPPVPSLAGFGVACGFAQSAGEGTGGTGCNGSGGEDISPTLLAATGRTVTGGTPVLLRMVIQRHILQLDALLADPVSNREEMCLALQRLVGRVALRIEFPSQQCREELTQDVFLHCLGQVGKQPREKGRAYHWFALVAKRKFWARLRWERKRAAKSLSGIDHDRARLRPVARLGERRVHDLEPLVRGASRERLTNYLDGLLDRTLAQHRNPTDAGELQITRGMALALQEVRRRVAGTYRRLAEGDLGYTERYRVEREES